MIEDILINILHLLSVCSAFALRPLPFQKINFFNYPFSFSAQLCDGQMRLSNYFFLVPSQKWAHWPAPLIDFALFSATKPNDCSCVVQIICRLHLPLEKRILMSLSIVWTSSLLAALSSLHCSTKTGYTPTVINT